MKTSNLITVIFCLVLNTSEVLGQTDTLFVKPNELRTNKINPRATKYLTYIEMNTGVIRDMSIWERTTSIETFQGKKAMVVRQTWKNQDSKRARSIVSVNDSQTMHPIYQWAKNGKGEVEVFNFYKDRMVGADSVANNHKKGFQMNFTMPIFNWELDLEFLSLLKYKKNQCYGINFYHPGSKKKPKTEYYTVSKKEQLVLPGNRKVICWLVTTQYAKNNRTTFWIEEKTNQVVKVEDRVGPVRRYKILLY